jgi:hypothetical protein
MDLFQATGVEFDQHNTIEGLKDSGLHCPSPDRDLLNRYFADMLKN